jgi:hypothetical protein
MPPAIPFNNTSSTGFFIISMMIMFIFTLVRTGITGYQYMINYNKVNISRHLLNKTFKVGGLLISAMVLCILTFIIVSMAIPKGTYWYRLLNNEYIIISIGILVWFMGPGYMFLYNTDAHRKSSLNLSYPYYLSILPTWIIGGIIIGIILWAVGGTKGKIQDYFIKGIGIMSMVLFIGTIGMERIIPRYNLSHMDNPLDYLPYSEGIATRTRIGSNGSWSSESLPGRSSDEYRGLDTDLDEFDDYGDLNRNLYDDGPVNGGRRRYKRSRRHRS